MKQSNAVDITCAEPYNRAIYLGILLVIGTTANVLCTYTLMAYSLQGDDGHITPKVHNLLIGFTVLNVLFIISSNIILSVPFLLVGV